MTSRIEETTIATPLPRTQLDIDEEIAHALFNEGVPEKYKNDPKAFEEFLSNENKKKNRVSDITTSKWNSLRQYINHLKLKRKINRRALTTPLISDFSSI